LKGQVKDYAMCDVWTSPFERLGTLHAESDPLASIKRNVKQLAEQAAQGQSKPIRRCDHHHRAGSLS
jgi:hypothetical protein